MRSPRTRTPRGRSRVGERFEVVVGPVAHGGHCVARVADGEARRVVFVRHALPGERVVLELTEGTEGDRFWRADAVAILDPSPDRVSPPCPYAGPGVCGGCDFQHATPVSQRGLKTAVVREQLSRLARIESDVEVEYVPLPDGRGDDGLRWRTRQRYVDLAAVPPADRGRSAPPGDSPGPRSGEGSPRGMRKHRSRDVVAVDDCLIAAVDAREPAPGTVMETVTVEGVSHDFQVSADGFWQVHPAAPRVLAETVLGMLDPRPGESVLDLYAGVGLFAAFLADRVGPGGRVVAVEGDRRASALSERNVPAAEATAGDVASVLATSYAGGFDLVVLDPPREGARRAVVDAVADRAP
ncbi:MAG: methyltransferase, partial [Nocardioides sp.]|uniref:class I SAM-dependent RNA methyltransferase n=1 Tax=Nocardioides sp. TaxID=35761 RepID=UPI0039E2EC81